MSDAQQAISGLIAASRLRVPDELIELFCNTGQALGASTVVVYLVSHEQRVLVPLPTPGWPDDTQSIDGTIAGRCFRRSQLHHTETGPGQSVWVPLVDGLERLGVVYFEFEPGQRTATDDELHAFAATVAELVLAKQSYGDLFHQVRRQQRMSLAGEILWQLLPPLTFGTDRLVISAMLAPAYDVGGDCFDYTADSSSARFAVFDAMGHGLQAGLLATCAIAAYRNARRRGADFVECAHAIDKAIGDEFTDGRFVTGVVAELDLDDGRLHWHNAGHPAPLLIRSGQLVKVLETEVGLPFGLIDPDRTTATERLEPGDRLLLYTDGITDARSPEGEFFGLARLTDLVTRADASDQPVPETMRRLMHAVLDHPAGELQDDGTALLVEWGGQGASRADPLRLNSVGV
ncbi:MAG: PP2C family protein-serine/threonine phosphatase [Acidothermaceae bacterium]